MTITINKEEVFRVQRDSFGISPSKAGYTLAYSFDNKNWSNWDEPVPANESLVVNGAVPQMFCKLVGNTEDLTAII